MSYLYDMRSGELVKSRLYTNSLLLKDSLALDPLSLFDGGKQGVWFDPSDKSTLFQNTLGTIPVTKDGDPVGLILDKSQGLEQEIVSVNGSLDTTDIEGWTWKHNSIDKTVNYTVGLLEFINPSPGTIINCEASIKPNTYYKVDFDIEAVNGNAVVGGFTTATTSAPPTSIHSTNNRAVSTVILNSGNGTFFNIRTTGALENLKIRKCVITEIKGNHALQPLAASRPIYKTDGVLHWLEFDGVDDTLTTRSNSTVNEGFYACSGFSVTKYEGNTATNTVFGAGAITVFQRIELRGDEAARRIGVANRTGGADKRVVIPYAYELNEKMVISGGHDTDNLLYMERNLKNKQTELNIELTEHKNIPIIIGNALGINFYGGVWIDSSLDNTKNIEKYFANKTGVTL